VEKESFKPESLSVKKLFGNADALYKIPRYQRPYKWEDEQVEKLWDDIYEAYQNNEVNYFLGSIITAKPMDDENSTYMDVIDGQQRLTTLMILFCAVRDTYPEINKEKIEFDPSAIDIEVIKNSIEMLNRSGRLKLFTHPQHQSDFESLIIKGDIRNIKKPHKYQIRGDEPKFKFMNTAYIFREKIDALGRVEVGEFINYIFNKVYVIRIDCSNREFAIKLFQVLNDRGMDLTSADLIKSFLIEKLYKKYKDDKEISKQKAEQFISDWQAMEQTINESDISLNDLFIIYEYYILNINPKKSLYEELQRVFKDKDSNEIVGHMKKFSETYYKEIYEKNDRVLYSFWYIRWNMYWKSILLTALINEYPHYEELEKQLRRFYYLYWIAGKTLSQIKQTSFNLIKWVKDNRDILDIKKELDRKIREDGIEKLALTNLVSNHVSSEPWIKPILLMMEYNMTDDSKLSFIEMNRDVHLEHILPIEYKKYPEWYHISNDLAKKWINSAGNLTLLSGKKNIEASNNPFKVKIDVYKGKGKYDDKNEKITAFLTTQKIVEDYGDWNEESMKERWKWFFTQIHEILGINVDEALQSGGPRTTQGPE